MGALTLFIGGAKSGKTKAALKEAERRPAPRYYLATAQGLDDEMRSRILSHQAERGPEWRTLESPLHPEEKIAGLAGDSVVLMDCVTLWFSNLLGESPGAEPPISFFSERVDALLAAIRKYQGPVIIVSNELGGGLEGKALELQGVLQVCDVGSAEVHGAPQLEGEAFQKLRLGPHAPFFDGVSGRVQG